MSYTSRIFRKPVIELEADIVRPAFTQKLKSISVDLDDTLELICKFIASPRPQVTWYHNDTAMEVW